MYKEFVIEESDWNELIKLSAQARNAPVMALSVADGLAGRDFASMARKRVESYWITLGDKYGFFGSTVVPVDEGRRAIKAIPVGAKPAITG